MKMIRNLLPGTMLVAAVCFALLFPSAASAQNTNVQGKFRLQNEVHWGKAVLPAGAYSLTLQSTAQNTIYAIIRSSDGKKAAFAMATIAGASEPGESYLFIANDGTRRVRLLNLPKLNLSLAFGPLTERDRELLYAADSQFATLTVAHE